MTSPQSLAARNTILRLLRSNAPARALPEPDLTPYYTGPYGQGCTEGRPDPCTLIDTFEAAAKGWRAEVLRTTPDQWTETLKKALQTRNCKRLAIGRDSPWHTELHTALQAFDVLCFDETRADWKTVLFDTVDAGITSARAGLADTGSLVLMPSQDEPRSLSLVPSIHFAILRTSDLYAGLPAAMQALKPQDQMPTNLLLITGPSKTADIQQVLAFGAHGPRELIIILVNDMEQPQ